MLRVKETNKLILQKMTSRDGEGALDRMTRDGCAKDVIPLFEKVTSE